MAATCLLALLDGLSVQVLTGALDPKAASEAFQARLTLILGSADRPG